MISSVNDCAQVQNQIAYGYRANTLKVFMFNKHHPYEISIQRTSQLKGLQWHATQAQWQRAGLATARIGMKIGVTAGYVCQYELLT